MIRKIFNKLFLTKKIRSQEGELHFLRYRLFSCPWLRLYIHKICKSDEDAHLHTHPWNFFSFILKGGYRQEVLQHPKETIRYGYQRFGQFDLVQMGRHEGHRITLDYDPTWTFVIAYGKRDTWGYLTESLGLVDHKFYRELKNSGQLPK